MHIAYRNTGERWLPYLIEPYCSYMMHLPGSATFVKLLNFVNHFIWKLESYCRSGADFDQGVIEKTPLSQWIDMHQSRDTPICRWLADLSTELFVLVQIDFPRAHCFQRFYRGDRDRLQHFLPNWSYYPYYSGKATEVDFIWTGNLSAWFSSGFESPHTYSFTAVNVLKQWAISNNTTMHKHKSFTLYTVY